MSKNLSSLNRRQLEDTINDLHLTTEYLELRNSKQMKTIKSIKDELTRVRKELCTNRGLLNEANEKLIYFKKCNAATKKELVATERKCDIVRDALIIAHKRDSKQKEIIKAYKEAIETYSRIVGVLESMRLDDAS